MVTGIQTYSVTLKKEEVDSAPAHHARETDGGRECKSPRTLVVAEQWAIMVYV
jgi:hypothetical protein